MERRTEKGKKERNGISFQRVGGIRNRKIMKLYWSIFEVKSESVRNRIREKGTECKMRNTWLTGIKSGEDRDGLEINQNQILLFIGIRNDNVEFLKEDRCMGGVYVKTQKGILRVCKIKSMRIKIRILLPHQFYLLNAQSCIICQAFLNYTNLRGKEVNQ